MDSQKKLNIEITKVKPKSIGQICPVCRGFRRVNWGKEPCLACEQRGYILVPAEEVKNG